MDDPVTNRVVKDLEEILNEEYGGLNTGVSLHVLAEIIGRTAVMATREILEDQEAGRFSEGWFAEDPGWNSGDPLPEMTTRGGRAAPLFQVGYQTGFKFGAPFITCLRCFNLSYHPLHVQHRYCPHCNAFHK